MPRLPGSGYAKCAGRSPPSAGIQLAFLRRSGLIGVGVLFGLLAVVMGASYLRESGPPLLSVAFPILVFVMLCLPASRRLVGPKQAGE
jgi:hypothetical protein